MNASLAIETHQLTRYFNDFCAVSGIDLAVERGTFYGFLGPNGAGKSTTIKMLTGLLAPSGGQMRVLGRNMLDVRESLDAKHRMGVIPEDLALFDNLTAREYLTFVGRIHLMPRETIRTRSNELLSILDLDNEEKKLTMEYSHGMKKKLALAAALLPNPDLLFLDEPFEGVDAVTSRVIRDMLAGFVARGSTVFLTSHVLEIVERLCTHVGMIVKGQLVEQASLDTIRQGGTLEECFLQKAGASHDGRAKAQLARGGDLVTWRHFQTFVWLRWRILRNQWRRAGAVNAVLMMIAVTVALLAVIPLFLGSIALGVYAIPKATPVQLMYACDAIVLGFLFFWSIGLITELQRSDPLTLSKFLHLPVSANSAFVINYLSSLLRLSLIVFGPVMLAFSLALVWTRGIIFLPVFPALAAFFLMVTGLTYQFQGWLASLMSNPRRRRTVVVITTTVFVLVFQLPNLINFIGPWRPANRVERSKSLTEAMAKLERDSRTEKIDAAEVVRRQQEILASYKAANDRADRDSAAYWERSVRLANMVVPLGWLPLGVTAAAEGSVLPSLLGAIGMSLIGTAGLWRAYRTTVGMYQGQLTRRRISSAPAAPAVAVALPRPGQRPGGVSFLETRLPGVSEPVAAIAPGTLRSLLRSPEAKMMLLSPLIMILIFGSMLWQGRLSIPELVRPFVAIGGMSFMLLFVTQMMGNQFGFDRDGFRVFVLCAARRRDILLGKNLAFAPVALSLVLIVLTFVQVASPMRIDHYLSMFPQAISMFLLFAIFANLLSIVTPVHVAAGSVKPSSPNFKTALLQMAMMFFVFPLTQAPTLIPMGAELGLRFLGWGVRVPICLLLTCLECALVIIIYYFMLGLLGDLLQAREKKILESVTNRAS